ncbi:MAG TPA: methionyl-tRNA formyltransferase [Patescibacteria group bacterium]|nr:methionyl-tRNA formyltransferase [Patescibacteria group bacterium]
MRIVFCGTPAFAVPALERLASRPQFQIEAVLTQPDRPRGRGLEMVPSPVKQAALAAGIPLYQPAKVRTEEAFAFFRKIAPDAVVIIAFGQIIPQRLIELPRLGWINLHGSLLPKYRGAAPIQWAIAEGETRTGLTTMQIDAGMDTGPLLLQWETGIGPDETAAELAARMAPAGAELVASTLEGLDAGAFAPRAQDNSKATLAPLLKREHGRIDWKWPAGKIYNRIRGFAPWPGAYTSFRDSRCHIWGRPGEAARTVADSGPVAPGTMQVVAGELHVACGEGTWLHIESVQIEGRKRIGGREFLSGARLASGERFDSA